MNYKQYEKALSIPRLETYLNACNGDKNKALILYRYNIKLSQKFYGILGVLEIVLRNAINQHYAKQFINPNWITSEIINGGIFSTETKTIQKVNEAIRDLGSFYSHDKLVASLTFGFWVAFFNKTGYAAGNKTLLQIFPDKAIGLNQKNIYKDLRYILNFRNRIAHHESIVFDAAKQKDIGYAQNNYDLIIKYLIFLGYKKNEILWGVDLPDTTIQAIDKL